MRVLNVGSGNRPLPHDGILNRINTHFGIGLSKKDEYTNIDKIDLGDNIVIDLENLRKRPLPFRDNKFDCVVMHHVFEHITDIIPLMNELWRVCKKDGKCFIMCPYWTHPLSVGDIDHKRQVNEYTFIWFEKEHYKVNKERKTACTPCMIDCDWIYRLENVHYDVDDSRGMVQDIHVMLVCKKDEIFN